MPRYYLPVQDQEEAEQVRILVAYLWPKQVATIIRQHQHGYTVVLVSRRAIEQLAALVEQGGWREREQGR